MHGLTLHGSRDGLTQRLIARDEVEGHQAVIVGLPRHKTSRSRGVMALPLDNIVRGERLTAVRRGDSATVARQS